MYPNKDEVSDKTDTSLFDGKNPIDEIAKDDIINTYRTRCSTCKIGGAFMAGIRKKSPERKTAIREFAERFYFDNQRSPSMTEIAAELKISRSTAYEYLVEMDREGIIRYDGKQIETESTRKAKSSLQYAPIVGRITCGTPDFAEEDLEEYIPLPVSLFGEGDFFILRTYGDSMVDAGIEEGDMVVLKKQHHAQNGDIVAILDGSCTTLKRFYYEPEKKRIRLHPENKTMKDILIYNLDDCVIQGVAQHVIKKL